MKVQLLQVFASHPAARAGAAHALRGVDMQIAEGEQLAVIGPSGAGKTTLLQVMACAMPPDRGEVRLGNDLPWNLSTRQLHRIRSQLFLAPQVPPLPPRQRVVTAVLAGRLPAMGLLASLRSLFYPSDIPAAYEALARFDLDDKLFERVDRLSGGERQRVGLARALLAPARLWLVDEPLSSLDPTRADQALGTLVDCARERGVTLVTTLHQVDAALARFPRIVGVHLISVQKVTVRTRPQSEHWRGDRFPVARKCLSGNEFLLVLQSTVEGLFAWPISAGSTRFRCSL